MSNITRNWNGYPIAQRTDGFINATAMCAAHGKEISEWFRNRETIELIEALADDLGLLVKGGISQDSNAARVSQAYPDLVISKRGAPENGGGTWLHPDLAVQLAQWCNSRFALQVSRWTQELMMTGSVSINDTPKISFAEEVELEAKMINLTLSMAGLDSKLIAGVALNHVGVRLPQLKQAVAEGHSLLAASLQSPLLLTPTKIGEALGISARKVNLLLMELGYQVKNLGKNSKCEPDYFPTDIGQPYASNTLATGRLLESGADNTTYQHLKWQHQIVEVLREQMVGIA